MRRVISLGVFLFFSVNLSIQATDSFRLPVVGGVLSHQCQLPGLRLPMSQKGNRNQTEGKEIKGMYDEIVAEGGPGRSFVLLWFGNWRFREIAVETGFGHGFDPLALKPGEQMVSVKPRD